MDNSTFINRLASRLDSDPKSTEALVGRLVDTFIHTCSRLDSIAVPGFGTFQPVKLNEHVTTDDAGNSIIMPPSITLQFKESIVLRKKINA